MALDYHAGNTTGLMLHFLLRDWLLLGLFVLLNLAQNVLVEVIAEELLLLVLSCDLIELIHWNVDKDGVDCGLTRRCLVLAAL